LGATIFNSVPAQSRTPVKHQKGFSKGTLEEAPLRSQYFNEQLSIFSPSGMMQQPNMNAKPFVPTSNNNFESLIHFQRIWNANEDGANRIGGPSSNATTPHT